MAEIHLHVIQWRKILPMLSNGGNLSHVIQWRKFIPMLSNGGKVRGKVCGKIHWSFEKSHVIQWRKYSLCYPMAEKSAEKSQRKSSLALPFEVVGL